MPVTLTVHATPPQRRFVTTPSRVPAWQLLHREADKAYPELRTLWSTLFDDLRSSVDLGALEAALGRADRLEVERLITDAWSSAVAIPARRLLPELIRQTVQASTTAVATIVAEGLEIPILAQFDRVSADIVQAIDLYAGEQIVGIETTTREAIREVLRGGATAGLSPAQQQAEIAQMIGLTPRQAQALTNLEARLRTEGLSERQIQRALERAQRQALRLRAESIARTESIDAANRGQQALWQQAEQQGLLPAEFRRFWLVTPDDRLCVNICAPIPGMNPQGVGLHEPFQTPVGPKMTPTAHPMCRCGVDGRVVR